MTLESQELMDGPASLDHQAPKETQVSQESQEDPEVRVPKEPWERWASQVLEDRKELLVCLDDLEVLDSLEPLVSLELKVNPDQLESAPQEYKDRRESQDNQVSPAPQD